MTFCIFFVPQICFDNDVTALTGPLKLLHKAFGQLQSAQRPQDKQKLKVEEQLLLAFSSEYSNHSPIAVNEYVMSLEAKIINRKYVQAKPGAML